MASGQKCTVHPKAGEVLDRIARINDALAAAGTGSGAVLESLRQLQAVPMTFEALETTKIGRTVNALRKSAPSGQARELAAALYRGWKALADEHFAARQAAPPTGGDAAARVKAPKADKSITCPSPMETKQSAAGSSLSAGNRSVTTPTAVDAKLEEAMPAIVEKQRTIRLVIKKGDQRVVLQTAVTPKPTPDPNSRPATSAVPLAKAKPATSAVSLTKAKPATSAVSLTKAKPATSAVSLSKAKPPATNAVSLSKAKPATSAVSLAKAKPATAPPKPTGSGACKRKEAPEAFDEARLARAKMRLHEGYKEASTVKEKRKIQVIVAPGKGRQRPQQVRCTAAGGTGKPPLVPRPRMFRAS